MNVLKSQFAMMPTFSVVEDGVNKRVTREEFVRESEKYITLGYGIYFNIPKKDAIKKAKAHTTKIRKHQRLQNEELKKAKAVQEEQGKKLEQVSEKLAKVETGLKQAKSVMDRQQKDNARLVQEKEDVLARNQALEARVAELQRQIG